MKKFWKWTNLTESNPTERILTLNGTIAEESWFDDDITPQLFKSELNSCSDLQYADGLQRQCNR